jgi:hypothetical protein
MALALEYTFSKPALDRAVAAGSYDNIRLFQYGGELKATHTATTTILSSSINFRLLP